MRRTLTSILVRPAFDPCAQAGQTHVIEEAELVHLGRDCSPERAGFRPHRRDRSDVHPVRCGTRSRLRAEPRSQNEGPER
jgi:hypothetical protein